jgi:Flp pilus assembly protein TadD
MSKPRVAVIARSPRRGTGLAVLLLVAAALAAYHNTFSVPFLFDDDEAIVNNPSLRQLWPPGEMLLGGQEAGMTGHGRPVVNLTLALNHAVSGTAVGSYHAVNLLIHALAGLVLFGLVRRTLRLYQWQAVRHGVQPVGRGLSPTSLDLSGVKPDLLALLTALFWLVHPLQTESVTYIVQRAESLAGLFYLLTLYGFVRMTEEPETRNLKPEGEANRFWQGISVGCCLLGMGSKEVMVTAPLLVLLYDRTFVAGSFAAAWRQRRGYYLLLASTWLPLAWLVAGTGGRGDSAGFDTTVPVGSYLLTQSAAVVHYLRLTVWPHPLVLDYGTEVVKQFSTVWWQALLLAGLALATGWALVRRPWLGFIGVWFFALLAPSSSIVPVATQTMAEHRMYLALAAPAVLAALGLFAGLGRHGRWLGALLAVALLAGTIRRNGDYASRLGIWTDTVTKIPGNARARNNLAIELSAAGRTDEAEAQFREALRLEPDRTDARTNLGNELLRQGRGAEAIAEYEQVLRAKPDDVLALGNLGVALLQAGRLTEARTRYEQLLAIDPTDASAQGNLGYLLLQAGQPAEALDHYERAARLLPGDATAQLNVAVALAQAGRTREALEQCESVLRLDPGSEVARRLAEQLRTALTRGPGGGR